LTDRQIKRLVGTGQWRRAGSGVYLVAGAPSGWKQALAVACLAGPPGTVASHRSAAALLGFGPPPGRAEITVPVTTSARRERAVAHRSPLEGADRCTVDGIPCTTPARTVVDCAAVLSVEDLCHVVDAACYRHPRLPSRVSQTLGRAGTQGRRGVSALREALQPWTEGVRPGSPAEARCLRAFARWGLPRPERQYPVRNSAGKEVGRVDFAWPDHHVLFEYDGEEFHGPRAWLSDACREAEIDALGWTIERGDKEDFRPSATRLRDRLQQLLGGARAAA
jgi:hypothetical protein